MSHQLAGPFGGEPTGADQRSRAGRPGGYARLVRPHRPHPVLSQHLQIVRAVGVRILDVGGVVDVDAAVPVRPPPPVAPGIHEVHRARGCAG